MLSRLHTASAGVVLLLTTTLGCAKKDNPVAVALGTGSYTLDGRLITCQATASLENSQKVVEYRSIKLTTTPQPAGGPETLVLDFIKAKSSPNTTYAPTQLFYNSAQTQTVYNNVSATLTETSTGVFSGTFSVTTPPGSSVTNGVFTGARL